MPPILFLDIDGVLLSGRAWPLPANQGLLARSTGLSRRRSLEMIGRDAVFDPCAVALVARICEVTGAQVVVATSWRYTVGFEQTRAKLLEQGLLEALLHDDWACSTILHGSPDKSADIFRWLGEHGVTHHGTWLVLDDEDVVPGATLRTDALDGLGIRDAAAAMRFFDSIDAGLGVGPLPEEDMKLVVRAFGGDRVEACRWLEGADNQKPRRHRPSALFNRGEREAALRRLEVAAATHAARTRAVRLPICWTKNSGAGGTSGGASATARRPRRGTDGSRSTGTSSLSVVPGPYRRMPPRPQVIPRARRS